MVYHEPAQTPMPSNVPVGSTVTVNARINPLPPGTYKIMFDMIHVTSTGYVEFHKQGVPRTAQLQLTVPDIGPQLTYMYPFNNYEVGSLTPVLSADSATVDAWPSETPHYRFGVCAGKYLEWDWCINSEWQASPVWRVPEGKLKWSQEYYWSVWTTDSGGQMTESPLYLIKTAVAQPAITAQLTGADEGEDGGPEVNPQVGNYTTTETDATIATVGPPLTLRRTYNSLDPRSGHAFGAGWTTRFDMKVEPDADGSGNVVVTYPDGTQVRFGRNHDGSYGSPPGMHATFASVAGGGWRLMDKSSRSYVFNAQGKLTQVTDQRGRAQNLVYGADGKLATVTAVGGRSLSFTWNGNHVASVSTQPVNGAPLTWNYTYDGDKLTKVCSPAPAPKCTTYSYLPGSHYSSAVKDTAPSAYWRFGETGGTAATSGLPANLGTDNGTYSGGTLGVTGALSGTTDTAVRVSGGSHVRLPDMMMLRHGGYLAVETWFKTTGTGVIFGYQNFNGPPPAQGRQFTPAVYVGTDGKLRGQFWQGIAQPITSAGAVNDGRWHHVVLSGGGNTQTLYLDGQAVGTLAGPIDHLSQKYAFAGRSFTSSSWPGTPATAGYFNFNGDIDELAIYDRPLGLPAVQEHYAGRVPAQQLTKITNPSGRVHAEISYDVGTDRVVRHAMTARSACPPCKSTTPAGFRRSSSPRSPIPAGGCTPKSATTSAPTGSYVTWTPTAASGDCLRWPTPGRWTTSRPPSRSPTRGAGPPPPPMTRCAATGPSARPTNWGRPRHASTTSADSCTG
ncbi:DUF6531 domain-containing protein [Spirillospora sp. CA-255316]